MKTYYHATKKENVFNIIHKEGLKTSPFEGVVYLSDTIDGAMKFMEVRGEPGLFAVIPVYLDESQVKPSYDHNPEYIKANGFVFEGNIPADKIEKDLHNIPLFELSWK